MEIATISMQLTGERGRHPLALSFDCSQYTQNIICQELGQGRLFDIPMANILTRDLQPGDTFLDIGCHVGYFSLLAWAHVGPTGRVFSFEPNPATFAMLLRNVLQNRASNIYAVQAAVSHRSGPMPFYVNERQEGLSSLLEAADQGKYSQLRTIHTVSLTLDELAGMVDLAPVRMMKIDVEGFEKNVIQGGMAFLKKSPPESIVFEINNNIPGLPPGSDMEIRTILHTLGYQGFLIHPSYRTKRVAEVFGDNLLFPIPPDLILEIPYGNILMTRKG